MSWDDWVALGETKHAEYYDGLVVVNPPTRRHQVLQRRLATALAAYAPAGTEVVPEGGWAPDGVRAGPHGGRRGRSGPGSAARATAADRGDPLRGDTLTVRRLLESAYRIQFVVGPGGTMSTDEPFPVTLDFDALFAR